MALKKFELEQDDKKLLAIYQADCLFLFQCAERSLKKKKIDANDLLRLIEGAKTLVKHVERTRASKELRNIRDYKI